jgi:hypothetical protein
MKTSVINSFRSLGSKAPKACHVLSLALCTLITSALMAGGVLAADPAYTFKAVTYIGNPAPGGGAFTNDFEPTKLNNAGVLAFTAEPESPGEEATFLAYPDGSIIQMVRFGQPAPGGGTISTFELGEIGLNAFGDAAFAFTLEPLNFGPPINGGVYRWAHLAQTLNPVLVPNVTADPQGGVFVGAGFNASLNERGDLLFTGFVTNGTAGLPSSSVGFYGSFVQSPDGQIRTVARPGDPSPDGGTFLAAGTSQVINDRGDVLFEGQTTQDPTPDYFKLYLRHFSTDQIELLPLASGVVFEPSVAFNNRGDVVYAGASAPPSVSLGLGAIYLVRGGATTVIAQTDNPAPSGGNFSFITGAFVDGNVAMNNAGNVVFDAATDSGDEAIYFYSAATKQLRRLAGIGTVIPGVGTIVSLEQGILICCPPPAIQGAPLSFVAINDRGQIAFAATVVSGTVAKGVLLLGTPQ